MFVRHKKSIFRAALRAVTRSYWDHTALILYPKNNAKGRSFSVIVESIRPAYAGVLGERGVALHRLDKYMWDPDRYDVGVKRVTALTKEERDRVRLFMLMNVDAPYWRWHYFDVLAAMFVPALREHVLSHQRFSCSSIIQKAFYDAMDWQRKPRVVFKRGVWSPIELLELSTPGDIADSANTAWVYNERGYVAQ